MLVYEEISITARRHARRSVAALPAAVLAIAVTAAASAQTARAGDADERPSFSKSDIFFELNHTDGDLGIHARIDGDGWVRLAIDDPAKVRVLDIEVNGRLKMQGLTELFTESAEPSFDELAPKDFFRRFPEGNYAISGTTIAGRAMQGTAMLSHVMPAPPGNIRVSGQSLPMDCDDGPVPAAGMPVVVTWDPVTGSHPKLGKAGAVKVVNYELVVAREEPTSLVLKVDLPPTARSFEVPPGFIAMDSGDGFKFEIVVREASGNQTVFESCFKVKR